ncbi:uncharacterized protein PHACADRAFT_30086 [Phanerochaete carnosa HHB-10118-sp]|uniref:Protein kinase domain-containing protein n=1 Tax=Phanerochaete carnosa (strain HHB-10118-sp) TaxID=650164 RepID=K5USR0_PHACS|nr:uncharacterized protein PHACADRAFT_30086 [Phanerochaete carnosa HHB-10118-sp]EKM52966.1 hypothetical protein PHACADRAFT_30086 [Phanerochaete carnosa HHB-10118-sp]
MRAHRTTPDISTYPERSPWDYDPPPYNLVPEPEDWGQHDTPELRAAALVVAKHTDCNPFTGTNPLHVVDVMAFNSFPWDACVQPPPLPQVVLPADIEFVQQLNRSGNSAALVAQLGGKDMVMKIFPDRPAIEDEDDDLGSYEIKPDPRTLFERESNAYAHLMRYGACAKGAVPQCYGWCVLSRQDIEKILALPSLSKSARSLESEENPPKALLIEYFAGAQPLSERAITPQMAQRALRALYACHVAFVMHQDIHRRNILLCPGGRVVWIDFDHAECASEDTSGRRIFFKELKEGWDYIYDRLLTDARIGYHHL